MHCLPHRARLKIVAVLLLVSSTAWQLALQVVWGMVWPLVRHAVTIKCAMCKHCLRQAAADECPLMRRMLLSSVCCCRCKEIQRGSRRSAAAVHQSKHRQLTSAAAVLSIKHRLLHHTPVHECHMLWHYQCHPTRQQRHFDPKQVSSTPEQSQPGAQVMRAHMKLPLLSCRCCPWCSLIK